MAVALSDKELQDLTNLSQDFECLERVYLFGSRALGTHRRHSDVDLALEGPEFSRQDLLRLGWQLEELPIPYEFDLVHYDSLTHLPLREHIRQYGQLIFEKARMPL